jgi:hypothetical protein
MKMGFIRIWLTVVLLQIVCPDILAAKELFANGYSDYAIVLADKASRSEKTAAKELQTLLRTISGATLPIVTHPTNKGIYIGWTKDTGDPRPAETDESFTYKTIGENLYIFGGSERGTMYGVYRFLERELGVHWYTSSFTKIPKRRQFLLHALYHHDSPAICQRLDFYYDALRHHEWAAHNLLNTQYQLTETPYGKMSAIWGMHTFHTLIPPSVYFKEHPEYYSIYKGKRSDKAQLCLSNQSMRIELTKNLLKTITSNPGYWCYDVSQNDNSWPCECTSCQQLVKKYGGHSGAIIWFVNQVAREVGKVYPNIYIGTFAYRYTRQAPQSSIRPADNVVIRLCDIECCFAHSLESCEQNSNFLHDMNDWRRIAKNIYIWDYTTGFHNYLLPFPNFDVLAANFRFFCRSNVIGILEEGAHDAPWSEFSELKQWLIAKLMWNPNQDTDSLATLFINDYYGKAAPFVKQYYDLCRIQVTDNTHFTIKLDWNSNLYSDSFVTKSFNLIQKALASVKDNTEEYKRIQHVAAQLYYLKFRRNMAKSATDGTLQKLKTIIANDHTILAEFGLTLEDLLKTHHYY